MLIYIDDTVVDEIKAANGTVCAASLCLEELASAFRHGTHLVFASRDSLAFLMEYELFSEMQRGAFRHIYSHIPQYGAIFTDSRFVRRMNIVAAHLPQTTYMSGSCKVLQIPTTRLNKHGLWSKTILLVENSDDANLLIQIGLVYLSANNLSQVELHPRVRGGGGSTIGSEYRSIQDAADTLCLCIADSDRKRPGGRVGDTARGVKRKNRADVLLTELYSTDGREVENLISIQMLEMQYGSGHQTVVLLKQVESVKPDVLQYLDLKEGVLIGKLVKLNPSEIQYWTNVLQHPQMSHLFPSARATCLVGGPLHCEQNATACSCIVVRGFGARLLNNVHRTCIQPHKPNEVHAMLSNTVSSEWTTLGALIASWCCGRAQLSV